MTRGIGRDGTLWLYALFGVCAADVFFKVPETQGRSLEETGREIRGEAGGGTGAAAARAGRRAPDRQPSLDGGAGSRTAATYRRTAMTDHTSSATPNGHVPDQKP